MARKEKLIPAGPAPGMRPDGTVNIMTEEEAQQRWELWQRQQAAVARGEDPTLLEQADDDAVVDEEDFADIHASIMAGEFDDIP